MSWDRDEMAAFLESIDNLVDALRSQQTGNGYGTQGTPDPSTVGTIDQPKMEIDVEPIRDFARAVSEATPQVNLFGRSLEMTVEKVAETIQAFTTLQGAVSGLNAKSGQNVSPGASGAIPGASIPIQQQNFGVPFTVQPSATQVGPTTANFIPQWWTQVPPWWNTGSAGQAAPAQTPTGQQRRRAAVRRRRLRNLASQRTAARKINRIVEGSIVGGIYGGPRGAVFGAGLGVLRGAGTTINPAFLAAATATVAMPFIASSAARGADEILDRNRQFAAFTTGGLMSAILNYDFNNFARNIEVAQRTSQTAVGLVKSLDAMQDAMVPARVFSGNLSNVIGSGMATGAAKFFNAGRLFFDLGNEAITSQAGELFVKGASEQLTGAGIGAGIGLVLGGTIGLFTGGPAGLVAGGLAGARVGAMVGAGIVGGQQLLNGIGPQNNNQIPKGMAENNVLSPRFAPRLRNFR
jgi:hypothetical protein